MEAATDLIPNMEEEDLLTIVEAEPIVLNNFHNDLEETRSPDPLMAGYRHAMRRAGSKSQHIFFFFHLQAIDILWDLAKQFHGIALHLFHTSFCSLPSNVCIMPGG